MTELEISFLPNGNSLAYVREGWSDVEPHGRWMVGPYSRLTLPPAPWADGPFTGQLRVAPFIRPGVLEAQRVNLVVNGVTVERWRLTHYADLSFTIPRGIIRAEADIDLVIEHEDAMATGLTEPGGDMRELAVSAYSCTLFGPERPRHAAAARPRQPGEAAVFRLRSRGLMANRMIEYMVGLSILQRVPDCVVSGVELDEWGLTTHGDQPAWADHAVTDEQGIDLDAIAARLREPGTRKIAFRCFGQRMENFPPLDVARRAFRAPNVEVPRFDERHLVIHVRAGDVLSGESSHYVPIPPRFYRELIDRTGLLPVFMGQLDPSPYTQALRTVCPDALFVTSQGLIHDFETIRRARNIVTAVTTFSWLAAWLSHADRVFMPVNGLLNPLQFPAINLLPLNDSRYEFHLFPVNAAAPLAQLAEAHATLNGTWRIASSDELAKIVDGAKHKSSTESELAPAAAPAPETQPGLATQQQPAPAAVIADRQSAAEEHPVTKGLTWMFDANQHTLRQAEAAAANDSVVELLERLRGLSLLDFGDLMWSLPQPTLPNISRLLPRMASEEAQRGWTGNAGVELMQHTVDFCRIVGLHYQAIRGRPLDNEKILDFGFGYGRIARVMYWYTNPDNYHGVDPMPQSLEICAQDGVLGQFHLTDYIPDSIAGIGGPFALILAYSVFTHTSAEATRAALRNLRTQARATTVLVITIRPVEHWKVDTSLPEEQRMAFVADHRRTGFAFYPFNMTDPAGRQVYGQTSMSLEWLAAEVPEWTVVGQDRGLDVWQTILFLVPR